MFGGDRFEDLIGQISIGKLPPPSSGGYLPHPTPSTPSSVHLHMQL